MKKTLRLLVIGLMVLAFSGASFAQESTPSTPTGQSEKMEKKEEGKAKGKAKTKTKSKAKAKAKAKAKGKKTTEEKKEDTGATK